MCNAYSGHVVTNGKHYGKVLVVTGIHHEKDREDKSVKMYGNDIIPWETIKPFDVKSGIKFTHDGQLLSEKEKSRLKEKIDKWINKKGNDWFLLKVIKNNQGSVYLSSLTTLPADVKFNNQGSVYLSSLTTLPADVKFNNQGYVDLRSLTTLPKGFEFNNQGYVDLSSLTTLPVDVKFNNQGYVDLRSLTTLPKGFEFNNQGDVYLSSLTTLPADVEFNNQGNVDLRNKTIYNKKKL